MDEILKEENIKNHRFLEKESSQSSKPTLNYKIEVRLTSPARKTPLKLSTAAGILDTVSSQGEADPRYTSTSSDKGYDLTSFG